MTRRCVKLSNDYQFNSALLFFTYQYLIPISSLAILYKHIWIILWLSIYFCISCYSSLSNIILPGPARYVKTFEGYLDLIWLKILLVPCVINWCTHTINLSLRECKWLYTGTGQHTANRTNHTEGNIRERENQCDIAGQDHGLSLLYECPKYHCYRLPIHLAIYNLYTEF